MIADFLDIDLTTGSFASFCNPSAIFGRVLAINLVQPQRRWWNLAGRLVNVHFTIRLNIGFKIGLE